MVVVLQLRVVVAVLMGLPGVARVGVVMVVPGHLPMLVAMAVLVPMAMGMGMGMGVAVLHIAVAVAVGMHMGVLMLVAVLVLMAVARAVMAAVHRRNSLELRPFVPVYPSGAAGRHFRGCAAPNAVA